MLKPKLFATPVPEFVKVKVASASEPLGTDPNANVAGPPATAGVAGTPVPFTASWLLAKLILGGEMLAPL